MAFDAYACNQDGQEWDSDEHMLPLDAAIRATWREAVMEFARRRGNVITEAELDESDYTACGMLHRRPCFILAKVTGEPVYRHHNTGFLYWTGEFVQRLQHETDWSRAQQLLKDGQFLLNWGYAWNVYDEDGEEVLSVQLELEEFWDDVVRAQIFLEVCAANAFWIKFSG